MYIKFIYVQYLLFLTTLKNDHRNDSTVCGFALLCTEWLNLPLLVFLQSRMYFCSQSNCIDQRLHVINLWSFAFYHIIISLFMTFVCICCVTCVFVCQYFVRKWCNFCILHKKEIHASQICSFFSSQLHQVAAVVFWYVIFCSMQYFSVLPCWWFSFTHLSSMLQFPCVVTNESEHGFHFLSHL